MAYSQNNVLIIPNVGVSTDVPQIIFTSSNLTSTGTITLRAYPNNNGTLSFEGSSGQLFSINNSLVGTLFSVNDISGIPSITVADSGLVQLAPYNGYVTVGSNTTTQYSGALLNIVGGTYVVGSVTATNTVSIVNTSSSVSTTTGALKVAGGMGVGGDAYHGGSMYIAGATHYTTGSNTSVVYQYYNTLTNSLDTVFG